MEYRYLNYKERNITTSVCAQRCMQKTLRDQIKPIRTNEEVTNVTEYVLSTQKLIVVLCTYTEQSQQEVKARTSLIITQKEQNSLELF